MGKRKANGAVGGEPSAKKQAPAPATAAAEGGFKNKEKVLVLSTRGITFRRVWEGGEGRERGGSERRARARPSRPPALLACQSARRF